MQATVIAVAFSLVGLIVGQGRMMYGGIPCVFPFEFQGESNTDCVEFSGYTWCMDAESNFGVCLPDETVAAALSAVVNGAAIQPEEEEEVVSLAVPSLAVPSPSPSLDSNLLGVATIPTTQQANRVVPSQPAAAPLQDTSSLPSVLTDTVPAGVQVDGQADADIVINEIASNDPVGGKDWFELYNRGDSIVDLVDWTVQDAHGNSFVIGGIAMCRDPFLTEILPGQFLKFSRDVQCSFDFGFGAIDKIQLFNPAKELVDSISWLLSWTTTDTFPTLSIGRFPDGTPDMVILKPTPGTKNDPASPYYLDATSDQGDGLLGRDHDCCQRLKNIGWDPTVPVMIIDTFGQPLFHTYFPEQGDLIIQELYSSFNLRNVRSRLCTCSDYEDYDGTAVLNTHLYRDQGDDKKIDIGFELRESDNETNRNFPLLGLPRENDWVLNNPENDGTLGFRNVMAFSMAAQMDQYASRYRFLELFVVMDGAQEVTMDHYEGVFMLLEYVTRDKNRVAIKPRTATDITGGYIWIYNNNNIDVALGTYDVTFLAQRSQMEFIFNYPEVPTPEEITYSSTYFNNFEKALLSTTWLDPAEGYRKWIDYNSFIDFLLAVEITKNPDGYRGLTYLHKDANGPLVMGPLWDLNEAFGQCCGFPIEGYDKNGKSDGYSGGSAISPEGFRFLICVDQNRCQLDRTDGVSQWYRQMWLDPDFRKDTNSRWVELRKEKISNEYILNLFNETTEMLREAAYRNYERWEGGRLFPVETAVYPDDYEREWLNDIDVLRTWLIAHMNWLDKGWKRFSA